MTLEEFTISTKTLEDFYGKELNITQKKIWYNRLKNYTQEKYERAVLSQCEASKYMPTLAQILETMPRISDTKQEIIPCEFCKGTGYILYNKIEKGQTYQYACLCVCQNAEGLNYNGLTIADKEHRNPYYIKTASEVFGDRIQRVKDEQQESILPRNVNKLINDLGKQLSL